MSKLEILIGVLLVILGIILDKGWNWLNDMYRSYIVFKYVPPEAVINNATKNIENFGTLFASNSNNDLYLDSRGNIAMVSGQEAFRQLLKNFMYITLQEHKSLGIGCEVGQSIFYTNNTEFQRQCPYLIRAIMSNNTLKSCIEQVFSISKRKKLYLFGEPYIIIEFKVKGRPATLTVQLKNLEFLEKVAKSQTK